MNTPKGILGFIIALIIVLTIYIGLTTFLIWIMCKCLEISFTFKFVIGVFLVNIASSAIINCFGKGIEKL